MLDKDAGWILAFDFGMTRIGVAVGNTLLKIPHPQDTITGRNKFEKFAQIQQLVDKWKPTKFVVGIPSAAADKEQLITNINKFANRLRHNFHLEVDLVNEDYTSTVAAHQLSEQAISGIKQKTKLDGLAACAILARYWQ